MLINGEKYACDACVRGHRVSNCTHNGKLSYDNYQASTADQWHKNDLLPISTRRVAPSRNALIAAPCASLALPTSNASVVRNRTPRRNAPTWAQQAISRKRQLSKPRRMGNPAAALTEPAAPVL